MSSGAERIAAERRRQIETEGYNEEHDDAVYVASAGTDGELLAAARCYTLFAWWQVRTSPAAVAEKRACGWTRPMVDDILLGDEDGGDPMDILGWPWEESTWKPADDPIRNLEKAGALIAAEIDRLTREQAR